MALGPNEGRGKLLVATIVGVVAIGAAWYAYSYVDEYRTSVARDEQRAADAKMLREALERYRAARGKYPHIYGDNGFNDLKADLVDTGFLKAIPEDPLWRGTGKQYRYVSADGTKYGIMFHIEQAKGDIAAGSPCLTGVGTKDTGWWSEPPPCPF